MNKIERARYANRGAAVHTENQRVDYSIYSLEGDLSDHWTVNRRDTHRMMDRLRAFEFVQRHRRGRKIHRCYHGAMITSAGFVQTVNRT